MDRMTATVLNKLKNQKMVFSKNSFRSSKCSSTPPNSCIIEVSTSDVALTSFVLNLSKLLAS